VYGAAPEFRQVEYFGESMCTGCNSDEFPEGEMSIKQYTASGVETLSASQRFMGMNNAYGSGSYYTSNYGNWQNGILQTRSFVDTTWGPWDPEYRSQANRSV
jgi:hypothetical protein